MKQYIKPKAEIIDVLLSQYCSIVNTSSYEISDPSSSTGGAPSGGIQQIEGADDL